jgi:hypothetical protein
MKETIYMKKNSLGYFWFTFPQDENRWTILMFGYRHNEGGTKFPSNGDILSFHVTTNAYIKVGKFFITDSRNFIVLAIDELGFIYGERNENNDYLIIDNPPEELLLPYMTVLEKECLQTKLNINSGLYLHALK